MKNKNYDLEEYDVGCISYDLINLPYLRKIKFKGVLKRSILEKTIEVINRATLKKLKILCSRSSPKCTTHAKN